MNKQKLRIKESDALRIAHDTANQVYRDLSFYEIKTHLNDEKWFVDYEINRIGMKGGGPHFVISAINGEILSLRFDQ